MRVWQVDRLRSEPDRTFLSEKDRQMFDRSRFVDDLAAIKDLSTPVADPTGSGGQIDIAGALPLNQDGCDEQIRPEHIGILDCPGSAVLWKVVEQRTDDRIAFYMSLGHQATDIRAQALAQAQVVFQDGVDLSSSAQRNGSRIAEKTRITQCASELIEDGEA
jgi:hypothetical protein